MRTAILALLGAAVMLAMISIEAGREERPDSGPLGNVMHITKERTQCASFK